MIRTLRLRPKMDAQQQKFTQSIFLPVIKATNVVMDFDLTAAWLFLLNKIDAVLCYTWKPVQLTVQSTNEIDQLWEAPWLC